MRSRLLRHLALPAVALLAGPWAASAAPEAEGSVTLTEPNGAFTAVKTFQVFAADNPENPRPLAGNFTYVYTIANQPDSFICLVGYDLEVPAGSVTAAGFIDGAGVEPGATSIGDLNVDWDFLSVGICPGQSSEKLFVHSAFGPGDANDNMVSVDGEFSLNTPGSCLGPFNPPEFVGEPLPCTIGFWSSSSRIPTSEGWSATPSSWPRAPSRTRPISWLPSPARADAPPRSEPASSSRPSPSTWPPATPSRTTPSASSSRATRSRRISAATT